MSNRLPRIVFNANSLDSPKIKKQDPSKYWISFFKKLLVTGTNTYNLNGKG